MTQAEPAAAGRRVRLANQQAVGLGQRRHQGTVLDGTGVATRAVRCLG